MKKFFGILILICLFFPGSVGAVSVDIPQGIAQGEPFWVELNSEKNVSSIYVKWMGKAVTYPADLPGTQKILLGAGLDHTGDYPLEFFFDFEDGTLSSKYTVSIGEKEYPEQRLTLPESMVTPPQEVIDRIVREREKIVRALNAIENDRFWSENFIRPVSGDVSSPFGVRRFLNDHPRSPHRGVDFRGPEGTPIKAMESGKVTLTGDFYYGGKTVILDHGLGLQTVYMHLSEIQVNQGEYISKEDIIGLVGMTGRSTGPHLHFGVYVLGEAVDPLPLVGE
ncbi:MAG: M23 family metallopeptidase [Desulfonatronovibrio sp. MSAO_Bac4]|nr:MAG: M23 family metallopeptidase [Desulfonatronovibrio sp. MSAO_Bac4]